jgi:hypothetical protein
MQIRTVRKLSITATQIITKAARYRNNSYAQQFQLARPHQPCRTAIKPALASPALTQRDGFRTGRRALMMLRALPPVLALAATITGAAVAQAAPQQIIILRHGEKQDAYRLCDVGVQRSLALAAQYLGKGAKDPLFPSGGQPDGFIAVTPHTLELASPAAQSWGMPVILYSALPTPGQTHAQATATLNRRTQDAARDVMTNPRWTGKTVVMVWEHHHIADAKLEKQFPNQKVTLRQLLNLDGNTSVPDTWSGDNFDYFWIVTYPIASYQPSQVEVRKQVFTAPFEAVPSNDWGKRPTYPRHSKCEK